MKIQLQMAFCGLILAVLMPFAGQAEVAFDLAVRHLEDELTPTQSIAALLAAQIAPGRATRAVVMARSDCDDTYEAVAAAVTQRPEAIRNIVSSATSVGDCGCSASVMWARSQLEARLRPRVAHFIVGLTDECGCGAATVDAASSVLPERTDEIIATAMTTLQSTGRFLDSLGEAGDDQWMQGLSRDTEYYRNPDVCEGDENIHDNFVPSEWGTQDASDEVCDDGSLVLSGVRFNESQGYVVLSNRSDRDVDLEAGRLSLDIYYSGNPDLSHRVNLRGQLEPGQRLIVGPTPPSGLSTLVQSEPGMAVNLGDTIALVQQQEQENCECADAVASAAVEVANEVTDLIGGVLSYGGEMACGAAVVTLLEEKQDQPAFFVERPGVVVPGDVEPPPPDVDPLASPN